MSDRNDQKTEQTYSLDDILAEYSSKSKVVEFPAGSSPADDTPPPKPPRKPQPVDEILPPTRAHGLAARIATWRRKADHYADHMYDRAEPDEETLKAEKYIPGVDQEEAPKQVRHSARRKVRRPAKLPPDTAAADLAAHYRKGLTGRKVRIGFSFFLSLLCILFSLELLGDLIAMLPFELPFALPADLFDLKAPVLSGLLFFIGVLCFDILWEGIRSLGTLRPGAETLITLAWALTIADGLTAGLWENRMNCLPCAAVTAFSLTFHLWGMQANRTGNRLTAKTASQARTPYVVTLDENKWSGRAAYTKWSGTAVGFGSQLQMPDAGQLTYRIAGPLLFVAGILCTVMASVGQDAPGRILWAGSAIFTAISPWSALLAYGIPYRKLSARLSRVGAALAGWAGAARGRNAGIITTDVDLFPPGAVKVSQVKVFGGVATEKAVAYTATLLRVLNCGLTRPFHDLLRTQGAFYREVSGVHPHEGGVSGIIRNQEVLVGTASFMHLMEVPMPQGLNVKNAVFCSISGQLAGMFLMEYRMSREVNPALSALIYAGVSPILATRDFNLIPALLGQKFRLPVDKLEFPPVERRLELSNAEQEHDQTPVALLCREGLTVFSDAVVGACRLRSAVRLSLAFVLLSAVIGLAITFYLTAIAAYTTLTPTVFLVFMALWLVPELFIANWVNQF